MSSTARGRREQAESTSKESIMARVEVNKCMIWRNCTTQNRVSGSDYV